MTPTSETCGREQTIWHAEPTAQSIAEVVGWVLDNPDEWANRKDWFVRQFAGDADGKATERVVKAICDIAL